MGVPTWMYRNTEAGLESAIFDSDDLPKGWRDSPDAKDDDGDKDAPKRRGRPPKDEQ